VADNSETGLIAELLISVVLPGIGAYAAIWVNNRLKSRSDTRNLHAKDLLHLRDLVSSTRELASTYWSQNFYDFSKQQMMEARITGALHGCSEIVSCLEGISAAQTLVLNDALGKFRRSCTDESFGSALRPQNVELLRAIEADGRALEAKVMSCRWKGND
jgi:hypothetical protein|tara:strand:+ start:570 stop:1049 length:480 start_codon:yes stop_codon:yes gene_type:complete